MVAMEALAKGHQPETREVVALHRDTIDTPALMAISMREMPDQPVSGQRQRYPHGNTPNHPRQSAEREERESQGICCAIHVASRKR